MKVGCGVKVGSGVFNSMVGGWSPSMGGCVVGRVENKPEGTVGEVSEASSEPLQATIASNSNTPTAILNNVLGISILALLVDI